MLSNPIKYDDMKYKCPGVIVISILMPFPFLHLSTIGYMLAYLFYMLLYLEDRYISSCIYGSIYGFRIWTLWDQSMIREDKQIEDPQYYHHQAS